MRIIERLGKTSAIFVILFFTVFALLPFYIMLVMGTYVNEELFTGVKLLPGDYLLGNLKTVLNRSFIQFYSNSIFVSVMSTLGGVLISIITGFAFAKYQFRFKGVLFLMVLGSIMVPPQLGLIGLVIEMGWFKISNTLWAVIIPNLANAFGIFWMTQYIKTAVPNELLESSQLDGCDGFSMIFRMVIPVIKPAIITITLMLFLHSWNSYLIPLVLINKQQMYTIPLGISILGSVHRVDLAARILALSLSTIPVMILFAAGSKHLIRGLTAGCVKG